MSTVIFRILVLCMWLAERPRQASYPGSSKAGEENRAWYQTYAHALDIAAFIPSVTLRSMTNDVFTEDDLLGRRFVNLGGITQHHQPRHVPQTTIVQVLVSDDPLATYTG